MSNVLVAGSVALDTVETPFGKKDSILGGAAVHFSLSARHFAPVRLVGVVGRDFPRDHAEKMRGLGIDTAGLETREGKTFRWHGRYKGAMDSRDTIGVELGVFAEFRPDLPGSFRDTPFVHLATAEPGAQTHILQQLKDPRFVMVDTIELWIRENRKGLMELLPRVHALCINHEEALLLSEEGNLVRAMRELLKTGLQNVIVKRAEHGSTLMNHDFIFSIPSYPTEDVVDPTGAGDAFAGGVLGYLAGAGTGPQHVRRALLYGSVMGSFGVEGFGTEGLDKVTPEALEERVSDLSKMITL